MKAGRKVIFIRCIYAMQHHSFIHSRQDQTLKKQVAGEVKTSPFVKGYTKIAFKKKSLVCLMKSFHFVAFEKKSNKSIKGERGERQLLLSRRKKKSKSNK